MNEAAPVPFVANPIEVFRGRELAPGEAVVWRGAPSWRKVARDIFHLRAATAYFALLFVLDAGEAWRKNIPVGKAIHDSVPLLVITLLALGIVCSIAWFSGRTTRYTITDRRVILNYGIAMPATLSIPFSQIVTAAVAVKHDHAGDIALVLKEGNRMPFLKLWPLARPWHLSHPQPTLRLVPQAAVVGGLLVRALQASEQKRQSVPAIARPPVPALELTARELTARELTGSTLR